MTYTGDGSPLPDLVISLAAIDDVLSEGPESYTVDLATPGSTTGAAISLGNASVTTTINDNDQSVWSISGTTSVDDKHLAVTFAGADLSRITGDAKSAMIRNLGKFDGATPIGAQYNKSTLSKSGWQATELDAAGWQRTK